MRIFGKKDGIGMRMTFKQYFIHIVRRLLHKQYCKVCGQELTKIRGRYPKQPERFVCACCATESLEYIDELNNIDTAKSNNA